MAIESTFEPAQTTWAKEELFSASQILHLAHHRNKNQHRLAKWYKHLCVLRRNITKLQNEVTALETAEKFSTGGEKAEKYVRDAREVVERRIEFMDARVMGNAYVAFSTVIKDLQYSSLGLMLMGVLAMVNSVIQTLGKEVVEDESAALGTGPEIITELLGEHRDMQDVGEVVSRDEITVLTEEGEDDEPEVEVAQMVPKTKKAKIEATDAEKKAGSQAKKQTMEGKKKKKQKRGDAFDDLFNGLI